MEQQNYKNHRRYIFLYHVVLSALILLSLIGSIVNLVKSFNHGTSIYSASLITVIFIILTLLYIYSRQFGLKAQDRAIRAEENLRHFVITGKLMDARLSIRQIIGLRFASDEEFLDLCKKAADENLSEEQIKQAIKNWRGDYYRV